MMKILKTLISGSLVLSFAFPAQAFASTPAVTEKEINDSLAQASITLNKTSEYAQYYADAKKTKTIGVQDILSKEHKEVYVVFDKKGTLEKPIGIHLKFNGDTNNEIVKVPTVIFRITDSNFSSTLAARVVEFDFEDLEMSRIRLSQAIRSAIQSTLPVTSQKSPRKNTSKLSKVMNSIYPSAHAEKTEIDPVSLIVPTIFGIIATFIGVIVVASGVSIYMTGKNIFNDGRGVIVQLFGTRRNPVGLVMVAVGLAFIAFGFNASLIYTVDQLNQEERNSTSK